MRGQTVCKLLILKCASEPDFFGRIITNVDLARTKWLYVIKIKLSYLLIPRAFKVIPKKILHYFKFKISQRFSAGQGCWFVRAPSLSAASFQFTHNSYYNRNFKVRLSSISPLGAKVRLTNMIMLPTSDCTPIHTPPSFLHSHTTQLRTASFPFTHKATPTSLCTASTHWSTCIQRKSHPR